MGVLEHAGGVAAKADRLAGGERALDQRDRPRIVGEVPQRAVAVSIEDRIEVRLGYIGEPVGRRQRPSRDTAGPMTRSVADAALLFGAMVGSDPADPATARADSMGTDFATGLRPDALKGVRVGVMRFAAGFHGATDVAFEAALAKLRQAGAVLVEIAKPARDRDGVMGRLEQIVLMTELKADMASYLASTKAEQVPSRTLADLIAFNTAHADSEMPLFKQELFEEAEKTKGLSDPAYLKAKADAHRIAGPEGIDKLLADNHVAVLVAPTQGPAWLIDSVLGDHFAGGGAGSPAAVAGYSHPTVPMGLANGLPVGLSFIGAAWSDAALLRYGYAYEQEAATRQAPRFLETIDYGRKALN